MATYSKLLLSGSSNGRNITVAATSSPGTLIHTASVTALDEISLFACNTDSTDRKLTLQWGGEVAGADDMEITIPAEAGWIPVAPGLLLTGGVALKAYTTSASAINLNGFVNRIT